MTLFRPVLSPGLRAGSHAGLLAALLACAAALAPPAAAQTLPDLPDAAVAHDGIVLLTPDNTRQVGPPARRLAHVVFPARSVPVLGGDPDTATDDLPMLGRPAMMIRSPGCRL